MVTASDSPYDLPIYPRLYRASKHDSVLFVSTFHELKHWYSDWKISEVILDSALDAFPIYEMLEHYDVSAIIDLNPRRSKQFQHKQMDINLKGVPVCPIGREMIHWGLNQKTYRRKWRCPAVCGKWECPNPCSDSDYGRTFYTATKDNPRLSAIIDLNPRRSKQFQHKQMDINLKGVPVCPIGREMIHWGLNQKTYRRKWRCPAVCGKWECPNPCSDSDYGRTFYTATKDNPRLFPRIKRDSKEWRKRYSLRTGVERCIKRQKVDYRLEDSRGRSSRHWNIRTYIIGMCQHADAWIKEAKKNNFVATNPIIQSFLSL
uniref:Transposase DDE domain-containing protein n=1 Tax=Anaerobacillus isosaccharinicus TaxID=1532552 RepID=A0A1S2LEN0_9BACI